MIVPMLKRISATLPALLALAATAPAARAQLVIHTDIDTSRTNTVHLSLGTTPGGTDRVNNEYVYAGPFRSTLTEAVAGGGTKDLGTFTTYCVKLTANIGVDDQYAVTSGTTAVNSNGGPALNGNGALIAAIARDGGVPNTPLGGEARQLALWSALYNGAGPLNAPGDRFTVNGADLKATVGLEPLIDGLLSRGAKDADPSLTAPVEYATGYGQDMVVSSPGSLKAVPEPSTLLMAGLGLSAALGLGWRRRVAKAA